MSESDPHVKNFLGLMTMAKDARAQLLSNIIAEMKSARDAFVSIPLAWCASEYQRKMKKSMDAEIQAWELVRDGKSQAEIKQAFGDSQLWLDAALEEIKTGMMFITPSPRATP